MEANSKQGATFHQEGPEAAEIFHEDAGTEALEDGVMVDSEAGAKEALEDGVKVDSEVGVTSTEDEVKQVSEDGVISLEAEAKEVSEAVTVIPLPGDLFIRVAGIFAGKY